MNERASWPGGHDTSSGRTPAQFLRLADVPPEEEWLANITNPVESVKWPAADGNEGSTPALGDARQLLDAPPDDTVKSLRDQAVLATLLYHGIWREELCALRVRYGRFDLFK